MAGEATPRSLIAPPFDATVGRLRTGEDDAGSGDEEYEVYRPGGRADWLLMYTISGTGHVYSAAGETVLAPGDALLVRPGTTHDYGSREGCSWHNLWAHFIPRGDALEWLDWPAVGPGVMLLSLPSDARSSMLALLREMHRFASRGIGRSQERGLNALEGALLLADEVNPRSPHAGHDPRIRRAIDYLLANLSDSPSLAALAEIAGLSRSQFALLFKEQVGLTPGQFVEQHRLLRVKRLLDYTRSSLQEIADEVGFSSPFYLSTRFKRGFGMSPRDYRRAHVLRRPLQ